MNDSINSSPETGSGRRPWLAALFSLLLPGLGQIYCRQDNKGVFLIGMSLLGQWSTGGLSSWILCPALALDAFLIARKSNDGTEVCRWEFFPSIKSLDSVPTRIMLLVITMLVAALTVAHILLFAADYVPHDK
jgi:TM2 domain-containing membrane protein YozV